jgi:hypothetical protein
MTFDRGERPRLAVNELGRPMKAGIKVAWSDLLLLMVVPALFIHLGRFELFPPPGWVDPEMYLGYFLNFPRALARFGPDYFSMRLPWTLTGFVLHHVLAPNMANYAMIFGFHYLALGSAYLIVLSRYGRVAGIAAAWWLAFNPLWLAAVTRGYVDGPAMALMLAGFACLLNRGRLLGRRPDLFLAGCFWALAIFTHPMLVLLTAMGACAWLLGERPRRAEFGVTVIWVALGGMVATISLASAGWALGAPFLFAISYLPTVERAVAGSGGNFVLPLADWLPVCYRMLPPFAFIVIGGAFLWRRRDRPPSAGMMLPATGLLLASVTLLEVWNRLFDGSTFQTAHYASYLLPAQAFVFGALAGELLPQGATDRRARFAVLACVAIAALLPVLAAEHLWQWEEAWRDHLVFWLVPGALFGLAVIVIIGRHGQRAALPLLMLATVLAGTANFDTRRIFQVSGNPDYKPYYRAAIRLNDIVQGADLEDRRLYFWYNRAAFTTGNSRRDAWLTFNHFFAGQKMQLNLLDSLTSLWLWDRTNLNFEMPTLGAGQAQNVTASASPASLILLCEQPADCAAGVAALAAQGVATVPRIRERIVEDGALDLTVVIIDVQTPE